jgi:hypothetical protein
MPRRDGNQHSRPRYLGQKPKGLKRPRRWHRRFDSKSVRRGAQWLEQEGSA